MSEWWFSIEVIGYVAQLSTINVFGCLHALIKFPPIISLDIPQYTFNLWSVSDLSLPWVPRFLKANSNLGIFFWLMVWSIVLKQHSYVKLVWILYFTHKFLPVYSKSRFHKVFLDKIGLLAVFYSYSFTCRTVTASHFVSDYYTVLMMAITAS